MEIHEGIAGLTRISPGSIMSIGNFDGLHLGHARILETMKSLRDTAVKGSRMVVVTFEPHPLTVLRPQFAPPRLTPYPIKQQLLEAAGIDDLVILPPTQEVLGLSAEQFWNILSQQVRPSHLVEGSSFNFGKNRAGTIERLHEWSAGSAVRLHVIGAVRVPLLDLHVVEVNSSLIRWLISYGRVRDAAIGLGRPYSLHGAVIRGYGRGRQIGVPTANLDCKDQLIPADGVYSGQCDIGGSTYQAALSVGTMPTFGDENQRQVEAHLIDFDGDLYDQVIEVRVTDWLRGQMRFDGVPHLKSQLEIDLLEVRKRRSLRAWEPIARLATP